MMFDSGLNAFVGYSAFVDGIAKIMKGEKTESTIVNSKNMEAVMILLVLATMAWGYIGSIVSIEAKGHDNR